MVSGDGVASRQARQVSISVRFDLAEHMQWIVFESIGEPTATTLFLVWHDRSPLLYESQAAQSAETRVVRSGKESIK